MMTRLPMVETVGGVPDALRRVTVSVGQAAPEAATYTVNYSNGRDTVHLALNPDAAPPEAEPGYVTRAAVIAALEPFRRYRRNVTRAFGVRPEQEALFDMAFSSALFEVEQLIYHIPAQAGQMTPRDLMLRPAGEALGLPDTFPYVAWLRADGVTTAGALAQISPEDLTARLGVDGAAQAQEALGRIIGGDALSVETGHSGPQAAQAGQEGPGGAQTQAEGAPAPEQPGEKGEKSSEPGPDASAPKSRGTRKGKGD